MTLTPYTQGSDAWHAMRAMHIGASEVAALFDAQPDYALSHYALWQVKAGKVPPPPVDNARVRWGLRLEPIIAAWAAEQEGWRIEKGGYASDPCCPGLGASLDYVATHAAEDGPGVIEIKNADWMVHRRTWTDGQPPPHILLQLQAQLAASGYGWGAVCCLVGGNDLGIYRYEARPRMIQAIRERVAAFWLSIREGRSPLPDGSDGASAVLRAMFPEPVFEPLDMRADNVLPDLCAQYQAASAAAKEADAHQRDLKNQILAKVEGNRHVMAQGWDLTLAVTPAKPPQPAPSGYVIPGRAESRRLIVKERATA